MSWKTKEEAHHWLAKERGTIHKDWGGKLTIALAFPNRYAVGMSNLGFQSVYRILNSFDDVVCERVFYPEPQNLELIRGRTAHLLSVESQRPLSDFHHVLFSIPFENDFPNAVEMLHLAGIPPHAKMRKREYPFVGAGGIAVFLNPEPLAAFFDFFFIGEAEALIPGFLEFWRANPGYIGRQEVLEELGSSVEGIYVPSLYDVFYHGHGTLEAIEPRLSQKLPKRISYQRAHLHLTQPCHTVIFTPNTEFSNSFLIETGRGCGRGCRFCAAGFIYRPVRYHAADRILEAIDSIPEPTSRVGLVSTAVSDHPQISIICSELLHRNKRISFSSLRANSITQDIAFALKDSRHSAAAIAVEAGSDRLRDVLNKDLREEDIWKAVELLVENGVMNLKFYFMIGLPTETLEDLEAVVHLIKRLKHRVLKSSRGQRKMGTITLSVNCFIPKPFTPFQWTPFAGLKQLKEKSKWLSKTLQKLPNVRVQFDVPKWAYVQTLLGLGDRRVSGFIEKVALEGLPWNEAMRRVPYNPDFWVLREKEEEEFFPWEIVDPGIERNFLRKEYQAAIQGRTSEPCRPDAGCRRCGVCPFE